MPDQDPPQRRDAYERLVEDIRDGTLKPGDKLTETELADRYNFSRTPIREAIRQLETEGLVDHVPRKGATLRKLDYPEITELYEMRAVLESTAARFAARAASDVELAELSSINAAMAEQTQSHELNRLNRQFHNALHNTARNRFLVKAVKAVQNTLLILGPTTLEETDRAAASIVEHEALMNALRSREAEAAEELMRTHIEAAHRARLRQLRNQEAG